MSPLGPLHGKSFATTISPWIVTLEALQRFRVACPPRNPKINLPVYLHDPDPTPTYDFSLAATVQPLDEQTPYTICKSNFSSIYWTIRDMVAQQTINGCNLRTGDILATGTISGSSSESHGCLMEVASKGGIKLNGAVGEAKTRLFLEDGDKVSITAEAGRGIGFGQCVGTIVQ